MEITQSGLDFFFRQANTKFNTVMGTTPVWSDQICEVMPSTTRSVTYGWMAKIPALREWVGPRTIHAVSTHTRTVNNKPWELSDALMAEDVRHDQFGVFNKNVEFMAAQARKLPDHRLREFLYNNTTTGYDGKYTFATDHPTLGGDAVGSGTASTQANLFTSTALTTDNYASVRAAMMAFKGEDGYPLGITPNVLMVPPALEQRGRLIVEAELITGALTVTTATTSNIWKGTAKLIVNPDLRSTTHWFLFDTTKPLKPFMWQQEMAPRFTYLVNPTDANVWSLRQFWYGVEAWGCEAETLWFLGAMATA